MVFYFSGTGNTRWAAQYVAELTHERLLFIPDEMDGDFTYVLEEGERIGFCFPVHGWQPPAIVRRFISKLRLLGTSGHYCYALCTCGDNIGKAMEILNKDLSHIGIHTSSVFSLIMPESYVCLPFMYTDKPDVAKRKLATARKDIEGYAKEILDRKENITRTVKGPTPWLFSHVIGAYFNRHMITDKPFRVDAGRCIHCGLCATHCPVDNIIHGNDDLPKWRNNGKCTSCLACYHYCPRHAINYGRWTERRGQYHFK